MLYIWSELWIAQYIHFRVWTYCIILSHVGLTVVFLKAKLLIICVGCCSRCNYVSDKCASGSKPVLLMTYIPQRCRN